MTTPDIARRAPLLSPLSSSPKLGTQNYRITRLSRIPLVACCLVALVAGTAQAETIRFDGNWTRSWDLAEGETVQIQVGVCKPGQTPRQRTHLSALERATARRRPIH